MALVTLSGGVVMLLLLLSDEGGSVEGIWLLLVRLVRNGHGGGVVLEE